MSPDTTYRKFTTFVTLVVLMWNIVGWLGFGLIVNHAHTHHEGNYCDITFCTCEVEKPGEICTCHHHNMPTKDTHTESPHQEEECYFSLPHDSNTNTTQALILLSKFNALYSNSESLHLPLKNYEFQITHNINLLSGAIPDLLRPPRV